MRAVAELLDPRHPLERPELEPERIGGRRLGRVRRLRVRHLDGAQERSGLADPEAPAALDPARELLLHAGVDELRLPGEHHALELAILDALKPRADGRSYAAQISFVADRPGHDRRYAIDADKIERELGWTPQESFSTGIRKTVQWYLDHARWVERAASGAYRDWVEKNYAGR